jgi:hypothetical protein
LDPSVDRPNVAGKIVVVGVTAPGVGETFLTPSGMRESSPAIQAEVIESVFANDTMWRLFWAEPAERATALLLGLAGGLLVGRVRYQTYAVCVIGVLAILALGSVWAFRYHGLLRDWVFPLARCSLWGWRHRWRAPASRWRRAGGMRPIWLLKGCGGLRSSGRWHYGPKPDTIVLGNLELASNRADASGRMGLLLGNATEAARKSAEIARHLLAFARLQSLNPKSVDAAKLLLGDFLNDVQCVAGARANHAGHRAVSRHDHDRPSGFELTLLNLAFNARDAMPDGGHLAVQAFNQQIRNAALGLDGDFLVLEVRDDGEGMSPDIKSNALKPFFTTKPVGQGTGLGLSQVHGFAHQSGRAVNIDSVPGRRCRRNAFCGIVLVIWGAFAGAQDAVIG